MAVPLSVRVPASTSNLGAGFDCLGLALDLWLEATLLEGKGYPVYRGTLAGLDPGRDMILRALHAAGLGDKWHLDVTSKIPIGKGLGSSGAAIVAGLALADLAGGAALNPERLFDRAVAREGHPDNIGPAIYGGLFLAAEPAARLTLSSSVGLAFTVPETGIETEEARARLPGNVRRDVAVAQAGRAAALVLGLTQGKSNLIALGMEDQLAVPHRKDLIPGFDSAVAAGRKAGAYGVTISGSGSALLAVTPVGAEAQVAAAMSEALTRSGNPAQPLTPRVAIRGLTVVKEGRKGGKGRPPR